MGGQNHELHRRNVGLDAQVKELFSALDEVKKQSAQHERNCSAFAMEKTQLKRQVDDLSAQRSDTDHGLNSVMSQNGIVHAHFEQVSGENNQLQMAVQQAQSENAALRSRLAGMGRWCKAIKMRLPICSSAMGPCGVSERSCRSTCSRCNHSAWKVDLLCRVRCDN